MRSWEKQVFAFAEKYGEKLQWGSLIFLGICWIQYPDSNLQGFLFGLIASQILGNFMFDRFKASADRYIWFLEDELGKVNPSFKETIEEQRRKSKT